MGGSQETTAIDAKTDARLSRQAIPPVGDAHIPSLRHNEVGDKNQRHMRHVANIEKMITFSSEGERASLLATKIIPPRHPRGVMARSRLTALAQEVDSHLLTLVKAPAGFGKTTLALTWIDEFKREGHRVGWFSADPEDNDPHRFFHYLFWAVLKTDEKNRSQPQPETLTHGGMRTQDLRNLLINQIANLGDEIFLIVDNYHCITHAGVHEHIAYLLANAPSNFHLVLLSQNALPFSLVRLQIQGQLLELDAALLRFTFEETASVLGDGGYGEQDIATIHAATRGWPAALRVAILSRARIDESGGLNKAMLTAAQPLQKMIAEWLDHMPADQADFLVRTAVVDRFCGPLCAALTDHPQCDRVLDVLENQQMMIARLDIDGIWFGYHQLFRDTLLQRLQERNPSLLRTLHRRASQWFAKQALWLEAVKHALAAGDTDQAFEWIETCAMPLVKRGDLPTLRGWERQLGSAFLKRPIKLRLAIAWAYALGIPRQEHHQFLDSIQTEIERDRPDQAELLLWECKAIRSILLGRGDDTDGAWRLAMECMQRPVSDHWMMNAIHNVLRYCHMKACRWKEFYETPSITYAPDQVSQNILSPIYQLLILGMGEFAQLRIHSARRHLSEAVQLSESSTGPDSVVTGLCAPLFAHLLYELMELDSAERQIENKLDIISGASSVDGNISAFTIAAHIAVRRNQVQHAHSLLKRAEMVGVTHGWPRLEAASLLAQMRLYLREGKQTEALACMTRITQVRTAYPAPPRSALADLEQYWQLAQGYYALANNRVGEAAARFGELYEDAMATGNGYLAITCGSPLALNYFLAHDNVKALETLSGVIELAAPAGIMASILDQGPEMGSLLAAFREMKRREDRHYCHASFVDALVTASEKQANPTSLAPSVRLSTRELNILELVAQLKSNKEISRALGIAPETVKSHIKNILAKLEVGKRMQAAQRAEALGLIKRST